MHNYIADDLRGSNSVKNKNYNNNINAITIIIMQDSNIRFSDF